MLSTRCKIGFDNKSKSDGGRSWNYNIPKEKPRKKKKGYHLRAIHPSSSSLLVGAGNGAPGPSWVGSWTEPLSAKGLRDWTRESREVEEDVLTGMSASRRDQPNEFMESRKDAEAMTEGCSREGGIRARWQEGQGSGF